MARLWILAVCPSALLAGVCLLTPAGPLWADPPPAVIYASDPNHLWNRLHDALFVRLGPDGNVYGRDRLEPLLWEQSRYLLQGKQAERAVAALEEFARVRGEAQVQEPLKRALLQRDLWLTANWLIGRSEPAPRRLLDLLSQAIHRLALTPAQIAGLPDNYASAVASQRYAAEFDPRKPERAYLPPDLFQRDGPWICVGRTDGRTAPAHLGGSSQLLRHAEKKPFTNSTFLIFIKLPAGREAGMAFLKQLALQSRPIFLLLSDAAGRPISAPNPDLPALPIGSELALVRRALLIDANGRVAASSLTESVQLRITTSAEVPRGDHGGLAEHPHRATVQEFQLRRADLFAGLTGGLRDASEERDLITGFSAGPQDEFEVDRRGNLPERYPLQPFQLSPDTRRQSCFGCHAVSNLYGTRGFQRFYSFDEALNEKSPPLFPLAAMDPQQVEKAAIQWKESDPVWMNLRKRLSQR